MPLGIRLRPAAHQPSRLPAPQLPSLWRRRLGRPSEAAGEPCSRPDVLIRHAGFNFSGRFVRSLRYVDSWSGSPKKRTAVSGGSSKRSSSASSEAMNSMSTEMGRRCRFVLVIRSALTGIAVGAPVASPPTRLPGRAPSALACPGPAALLPGSLFVLHLRPALRLPRRPPDAGGPTGRPPCPCCSPRSRPYRRRSRRRAGRRPRRPRRCSQRRSRRPGRPSPRQSRRSRGARPQPSRRL